MRLTKKNSLKKQIGNGLWGAEWSRDRGRRATLNGQGHDPIRLGSKILKTARDAIQQQLLITR